MKTNIKSWILSTINRRKKKINPKPQYQRTEVWSEQKDQLLIDTILRGYDIPKIYLRTTPEENYEHEVIDGQQRLKAIWGFFRNKYPLGDSSKDLPLGDLSGKKYNELDSDTQDLLDLYELSVVIIEDSTDEEVRDLFLRLQEGVTLNPPEKRNAMVGNMRDFIAELSENHKIFKKVVPKKDKRFSHADWLAHVVCLELAKGPTDVKAPNLKSMYENNKKFNKKSSTVKMVKQILTYIAKTFEYQKTPELDVKWGFVDFYLLISLLIKEYVLHNKNKNFGSFYIGFERKRRISSKESSKLIGKGDYWSKELYDYIEAFRTSGGIKSNIKIRNKVYTRRLFKEVVDLESKDPKRSFDRNQKIVIWRRDNGKCQKCKAKVDFSEMHADHITPHSKGGKTTIENGQTLCATCNLKKSSKSC